MAETAYGGFHELTPDRVIELVEDALGERLSSGCRPLNSYINRVYALQPVHSEDVVVKFYRPGRWSATALQDEVDFLLDLQEADVPVIPPITNDNGTALHQVDGMTFSVFPKMGGRIIDEPTQDEWEQLGRLIGRVHAVGGEYDPEDRITLDEHIGREHLDLILKSGQIPEEIRKDYEQAASETLDLIAPMFEDVDPIRIHGDLHVQNLIDRPGDKLYIIDFDDMAVGPPVQDIWMLLPGRLDDARYEMERFLRGYETFCDFDHGSLRLIEALRALRFLHFTAWCARQVTDGGFTRLAPNYGSIEFWRREANDLRRQQVEIRDALR